MFASKRAPAQQVHVDPSEVAQNAAAEVIQNITTQSQALHNATVSRIQSDTTDIAIKHSAHISGLIDGLRTAAQDLRTQTNHIEEALRTNTHPGNWGMMQFDRLVELSGMQGKVFPSMKQHATDPRSPLVRVVRFANNAQLTVDFSMPLDAFFAGVTDRKSTRLNSSH